MALTNRAFGAGTGLNAAKIRPPRSWNSTRHSVTRAAQMPTPVSIRGRAFAARLGYALIHAHTG